MRRPWAERVMYFVNMRPAVAFGVQLALVAFLCLAPAEAPIGAFYAFLSPALLVLLVVINLPLVAGLFQGFELSPDVRRNHSLEHATIHFLIERHGGRKVLSGRATPSGFLVSGVRSERHLLQAFAQVQALLDRREPLPAVSSHCGSNIVTGQALAFLLPCATGAFVLLLQTPPAWALLLLALDVALFVRWRIPLGNWLQRRYFVAADIAWAEIRSIEPSRYAGTFFVRTRVEPWQLAGDDRPAA